MSNLALPYKILKELLGAINHFSDHGLRLLHILLSFLLNLSDVFWENNLGGMKYHIFDDFEASYEPLFYLELPLFSKFVLISIRDKKVSLASFMSNLILKNSSLIFFKRSSSIFSFQYVDKISLNGL